MIARRMAKGLIRAGNGKRTIAELLAEIDTMPGLEAPPMPEGQGLDFGPSVGAAAAPTATAVAEPTTAQSAAPAVVEEEEEEGLAMEPYIDTARCTTCDECTNLNRKLFAYNDVKQAYIKDPKGGPFKHLVLAAEKCPVDIIHPGTPLNPKERDLEKWMKRAEPFN